MNPKRIALLGLAAGLFAACMAQPTTVAAETPALKVSPPVMDSAFVPATVPTMYTFETCATLPTISVVKANHASMASIAPADSGQHNQSRIPLGLVGVLLAGTLIAVSGDKNAPFASDSVRVQHNQFIALQRYLTLNKLLSTTLATQPVCATATVTSKVKTTNATVTLNNGVAVALAATDNNWILTGGVLAVSSFRKYLLLSDAANVATVLASTDAATAAGCLFNQLPADGQAICGILTVATDATHPFTPAVTLLGAAGITATFIDGMDDTLIKSIVNTITP